MGKMSRYRYEGRWKKGIVGILCICMLFVTACGGGGEDANRAMGRYVESRLDSPLEDRDPMKMIQRSDGTFDLYFAPEAEGGEFTRYNTKDGKDWKEQEVLWRIPEKQYYSDMVYDKEGNTYIMSVAYNDNGTIAHYIYRAEADGTLTSISMDWKDETGAALTKLWVSGLAVADNGDLLVGQSDTGVGQYGSDGSFKRVHMRSQGGEFSGASGFTVSGNNLYIIDSGAGAVNCFNLEDGKLIRGAVFDSFGDGTQIAGGREGAVYLYNRSGIFRLAEGGSMWEKLVDGGLTSMTVPSLYFSSLLEGTDGAFYMIGGDGSGTTPSQLYKYTYDENVATLPEKELVIYTLSENRALRQAAGEFQRTHSDTRVNIQVAMGEDSAVTKSELIRTLNTELLGGKGPDMILLDGLPAEAYIEKGVLIDLTEALRDVNADQTMNEVVINTFKNKNGVFAVPTMFEVPIMTADKDLIGAMKDLNSLAAFAKAQPDKPLIGDKSAQHLMKTFLPSCAPAWIRDGVIDEGQLRVFLEELKAIASTPSPSYTPEETGENISVGSAGARSFSAGDTEASSEDVFHWAFGRAHAFVKNLKGSNSLMNLMLAMREQGNSAVMHQPGQSENVYLPKGVVGINAKSEMADSAVDFLKVLLSDSVQEAIASLEGFPVNLAALDTEMKKMNEDVYFGVTGNNFDPNEELEGGMPTPEEKKPIQELCNTVKTPYLADDILAEMIINEAQGYFAGEKDIDKAISDISEATKLYLSE